MKSSPSLPLYLIDISSFIFRAYYAVPPLHTPSGEPTNAVYGVINMLARLIEEARPDHLAVVYDSREGSLSRKKLYPAYKAHRSQPPEDLIPQFARVDELVEALRIPSFRREGLEADDLIAALTQAWCQLDPQHEVVIITGDKDLMQLVSDRVRIWDTLKGKFFTPEEVFKKWGVHSHQIRDYLALVGDSSDGIPGVPSVGPKTAADWLSDFQHFEGIFQAAREGKLPAKKAQNLLLHEDLANLSRNLVTFEAVSFEPVSSDPLLLDPLASQKKIDFHSFEFQFQFTPACQAFFRELHFDSLLKKWTQQHVKDSELAVPSEKGETFLQAEKFRTIDTEEKFQGLLKQLESHRSFALDLETTSLDPHQAEIVGLSFCYDPSFAVYIPIRHLNLDGTLAQGQLPAQWVLDHLRPFLESPAFLKWGQNLKYDWSVLRASGFSPQGMSFDTMMAAYLLDPEGKHSLAHLAEKYLQYQMLSYEEVCGEKGENQLLFHSVPIPLATRYSAEDAWVVVQLKNVLEPKLAAIPHALDLLTHLEVPLIALLSQMELRGVTVDLEWFQFLSQTFGKEMNELARQIQSYSLTPFNLNSPKQLASFLFEELNLPPQSKKSGKTGYSTDAEVLEALVKFHPVARLLLEYRELSKLKGTYVDALPGFIHPKTGRVHASFHQAGTATGRLSSSHPNLQNIPIRTERGLQIRKGFVASPGCLLISADYSQIELRILAHMSQDLELLSAFQKGEDVHRRTASELFQLPPSAVTGDQRRIAKAINFGLMYGKSVFGLSQELKIPRAEAQHLLDSYFQRYGGVKQFLGEQIQTARETGWAETLLGRRRYLEGIQSKNHLKRTHAERMAMNTPIQGTAADLMKRAMIRIHQALQQHSCRAGMVIQIHDEILLDCPEEEVSQVQSLVREAMEKAMILRIPLVADLSVGKNWMSLKA